MKKNIAKFKQDLDDWEFTQTKYWQEIFDDLYVKDPVMLDSLNDISGWNSSYTGKSLSGDMLEWISETIKYLKILKPSHVLEIGCGTGLLTLNLAGSVNTYCGIDFSEKVLARLFQRIKENNLDNVQLFCQKAHEVSQFKKSSFNLIILNSVVQYFPSTRYLEFVLNRLIPLLAPNGYIFIGDVRNLLSLEIFHRTVLFSKLAGTKSIQDLKKLLRTCVNNDEELILNPTWFLQWVKNNNLNADLKLQLKRGKLDNEMNKFRYDVTLQFYESSLPDLAPVFEITAKENLLENIEEVLKKDVHPLIISRNILHQNLQADAHVSTYISLNETSSLTLEKLRNLINKSMCSGYSPETFLGLGEKYGYNIDVIPSLSTGYAFHVVYSKRSISNKQLLYKYFFPEKMEVLNNDKQIALKAELFSTD